MSRGCAQGLHAGVACTRVVGTLSQSDYTGVACNGCMCRGCMCKGGGDTQLISLHRGCVQGLHAQGLRAQGLHSVNQITQGLHAMVACAGVVHKGGGDTQSIRLHRSCMLKGDGDTQPI